MSRSPGAGTAIEWRPKLSSGVMFMGETPESAATRAAVESLVFLAPQSCRKALRSIIGRQLRDTIGAWRKQATPGGDPWKPNSAAVAEWKARVLGQTPVQVGIVTGNLRQSISSDINEAALEGRVGTSVDYAPYFHARSRFLPTTEKATREAHETVERVLRQTIQSTGLRLAGAGGLGMEEFL